MVLSRLRETVFGARGLEIVTAETGDAKELADLHAQGFERNWDTGEFYRLLAQKGVTALIARSGKAKSSSPFGFVVVRQAADEAEVLSICTAKQRRKRGVGISLMREVLSHLAQLDCQSVFLEVAADNIAAISLYRKLGFKRIAERPGYYQSGSERKTALVMQLALR
ncbi:MAG: ribosomal protein S18-alanine N-acetyltransferase [Pseudomonadota bacterium]